jgi:hypothetical protein
MTMTTADEIQDEAFEEAQVAEVRCLERKEGEPPSWEVKSAEGWILLVQDERGVGVPPAPGETLRTYGRGIGYPVRGVAVGGRVYRYETPAAHDAERARAQEQDGRTRRAAFAEGRAVFDARVAALPAPLRARMEGFLAAGPDWGWKLGDYELFACEEAAKLAAALGTTAEVEAFARAPVSAQRERVPAVAYDEHSGNTFGAATVLARMLHADPAVVPKMHASLCPLVGCEDGRCWSVRGTAEVGTDG